MEILLNAALLVAIIAYLSDRKKEKLTYITEERQKWRERIRRDVPKLVKLTTKYNLKKMKLDRDGRDREEAIEIINYLLLSLNPKEKEDVKLKKSLHELLENESIDREMFVCNFSDLLKTEWEKGKYEASNVVEILIFSIFGIIVSVVYIIFGICNTFNYIDVKNIVYKIHGNLTNEVEIILISGMIIIIILFINILYLLTLSKLLFNMKNCQELLKNCKQKKKLVFSIIFIFSFNSIIIIKLFNNNTIEKKEKLIEQNFYLEILKSINKTNCEDLKGNDQKNILSNNETKDNNITATNNEFIGNKGSMENKFFENSEVSFNFNFLEKKEKLEENKVYFEFDKAELTPSGINTIKKLVLKKGINKKVTLITSADTMGTEEYNLNLKKKRAEIVKKELVNYGIPVENISTQIINNFIQTADQIKEPLNKAVEIKISDEN